MSTQKFSHLERQAIWEVYDKTCFYCRELVAFKNIHIDHFIPESTKDAPKAVKDFAFPPDFSIFGFENLVLACPNCNLRKSAKALCEIPTGLLFAKDAVSNGVKIKKRVEQLEREMQAENAKGFEGHFVRWSENPAEIYVQPVQPGLYNVTIEHCDGTKLQFSCTFLGGKTSFRRDDELDWQNDTKHPGGTVYLNHLGQGIAVQDSDYSKFAGTYERTLYTHSQIH